MTEQRGVPIDEAELPAWARPRFSVPQLELNPGLQWILLIYMSPSLESSRINVAQRLHVHTLGKTRKEASPSYESLARDLNISPMTVNVSIDDLEGQGWILVGRRSTHYNSYRLAWPLHNVLDDGKEVELCGQLTKKGVTCTRRAGWGTDNPGAGPCKLHPTRPQPLRSDDAPAEPSGLQPLESPEQDSTPTVGDFNSNHWSNGLQPLEHSTPTVGVEYVSSSFQSSLGSSSGVLAVGERTVRNARAAAPPAQPENLFAGRSLITAIPRYRAAPGWVRKHLTTLAAAALAAGFHRDQIVRHAELTIGEARYRDHQHIPEFRDALRRLGRDRRLGDLTPPEQASPTVPDAPWTDEDQAAWEQALEHLGLTPDDLDTTGTD